MRESIVGLIFFAAIGLLGYFTVYVEDVGGVASGQGVDRQGEWTYKVVFDQADGLEKGHRVKASGVNVGKVTDLVLRDDGRAEATLTVWRELPLREDYQIRVRSVSALGQKYVGIDPGTPEQPMAEASDRLTGQGSSDLLDTGGKLLEEIREDAKKIFANLRLVTDRLAAGQGPAGRLLNDEQMANDLAATVSELRKFTEQLNNRDGTIGKLLADGSLFDRLNRTMADVERIVADVRAGKGSAGKLLTDTALHDELLAAIKDARGFLGTATGMVDDMRAGKGTVGKLLTDATLYDNLNATIKDVRAVAQDLRTGNGTIQRLLREDDVYKSLQQTASDLAAITADLRRGRGTLGKLLNDDTLYDRLKTVVTELGQSIEDTREQAPINTFTNVIFNLF